MEMRRWNFQPTISVITIFDKIGICPVKAALGQGTNA